MARGAPPLWSCGTNCARCSLPRVRLFPCSCAPENSKPRSPIAELPPARSHASPASPMRLHLRWSMRALSVPSNSDAPGELPAEVMIGTPEGFAFYLLHPLSFRDLAREMHPAGAPAAVVGIRSIGATLSAIVAVALEAERITVRPAGHPYDRVTTLDADQLQWVARPAARDAIFYVVDEGPGFSGSSLLSTCEALERARVPPHRIVILCTAQPDPASLVATNAAQRWGRYQACKTFPYLPPELRDAKWYNADHWRMRIYGGNEAHLAGGVEERRIRQVPRPRQSPPLSLHRLRPLRRRPCSPATTRSRPPSSAPGRAATWKASPSFWMQGGSAFALPRWTEKIHDFILRYVTSRVALCPARSAGRPRQSRRDPPHGIREYQRNSWGAARFAAAHWPTGVRRQPHAALQVHAHFLRHAQARWRSPRRRSLLPRTLRHRLGHRRTVL